MFQNLVDGMTFFMAHLTQFSFTALALIKRQLALDVQCMTPSLLAKWLPSENASSKSTKKMGNIVRKIS